MTEKLTFSINDNNEIVETNFFYTRFHKLGLCYVLNHEDCFHFFIPKKYEDKIEEMKTGTYAVITLGYNPKFEKHMIEMMFEDFTSNPYNWQLSPIQWNCNFNDSLCNKILTLKCYTQKEKVFEMDLFLREGHNYPLPFLNPLKLDQMITCCHNSSRD